MKGASAFVICCAAALALAGCGSEPEAEQAPARLSDRPAVTPSEEIEGLARRVAARLANAAGSTLPGGLRFEEAQADGSGVLYVLSIREGYAEAFTLPAEERHDRVLGAARSSLARESCPLATRLERALLDAGGELRHRYQFADGRPSYELGLRLEDCQPVWTAAERSYGDEPGPAPAFADIENEGDAASPAAGADAR